jgi:uncharacterized delta-60 repeat protein
LEDRVTPSTGGLLDPTFGSGGTVLSSFTNNHDQANAVTAQPDGKIVIAGQTSVPGSGGKHSSTGFIGFLVARYNADGSLDASFGSGGYTATWFASGTPEADAVALQPQANGTSKILAAGLTAVSQNKGGTYIDEVALARYNADGTLDTTFGTNGTVITELAGQSLWVYAMAVDGSGRIVVAGNTGSGRGAPTLVRYTPNGALDTSFGTGGVLITNMLANGYSASVGVVLQPDGKIVLAGSHTDSVTGSVDFVTARFNANGTADSTFGNGGVVTTHGGTSDGFDGVTIQGDGKIVVSGTEYHALDLLRYNADGSLDSTFGTGGTVSVPLPDGGAHHGGGVVVQADGKIIAGGNLPDGAPNNAQFFGALRVNPDGSVDTGYGNGGWAMAQIGPGAQEYAMALEPDGRLVLAGYAVPNSPAGPTELLLVRFLGSAPQVGSFTASPNPVTAGGSTTLTASSISDGNPNSTVTQVAFYIQMNGADTLLGYGTQSSPGVWTFAWSTAGLTAGTYTLYAQAQDGYGALGDPDAIALTVQ